MGKISAVYLMPHPPIIIPEVGRGEKERYKTHQTLLINAGVTYLV